MTLLVASLLLGAGAAAWAVLPIFARRTAVLRDAAPSAVLDAQARKQVALASLREVDYEFAAGKLDTADYEALREQLAREALFAIRAAERVRGATPAAEPLRHDCGFLNPAGSRFCAGCGARLA